MYVRYIFFRSFSFLFQRRLHHTCALFRHHGATPRLFCDHGLSQREKQPNQKLQVLVYIHINARKTHLAHDVGQDGPRGPDQSPDHGQQGLVEHEALRTQRPPRVRVEHGDDLSGARQGIRRTKHSVKHAGAE